MVSLKDNNKEWKIAQLPLLQISKQGKHVHILGTSSPSLILTTTEKWNTIKKKKNIKGHFANMKHPMDISSLGKAIQQESINKDDKKCD